MTGESELLEGCQDRIDATLATLLESAAGIPQTLREAMAYSLLAPGKRLRPKLVLAACQAAGGKPGEALAAGAAVEMVHTYSLIHDDLPAMDDDDVRRGRPTCHKIYGEAMAILAGDALLTLAFEVLASGYAPPIAAACCKELARGAGASGMVGGQVLDLAWEKRTDGQVDDLQAVHEAKTGALFRAALRIGGLVAQANPAVVVSLDRFGQAFGLMFQITDDLLDVDGDAGVAGKAVGKDATRGKLTYPGLLGMSESRRRAQELSFEAEAALEPLGPAAKRLKELARDVCGRDR
ncbi:MAG: polyprenyl synthetase family protein [Gemmataceae bacterium]